MSNLNQSNQSIVFMAAATRTRWAWVSHLNWVRMCLWSIPAWSILSSLLRWLLLVSTDYPLEDEVNDDDDCKETNESCNDIEHQSLSTWLFPERFRVLSTVSSLCPHLVILLIVSQKYLFVLFWKHIGDGVSECNNWTCWSSDEELIVIFALCMLQLLGSRCEHQYLTYGTKGFDHFYIITSHR